MLSSLAAKFPHRDCLFLLSVILICLLFCTPLRGLLALSLQDDRYAHILLIPVISVALYYFDNKRSPGNLSYSPVIGLPLMALCLGALVVSRKWPSLSVSLNILIGALVLAIIGSYIWCYGIKSFNHAGFPLLLLLLMIPIPSAPLEKIVKVLQIGSAEVSYLLFQLVGVPVFRRGTVMSLPGLEIEVARQCSGIRSTMALLVATLVLSHVLLRSGWSRLLVILCVGPIGILRNAVRIVMISLLGVYVDRRFLVGDLHRRGGLLFSLIGFAVVIPIVCLLRCWERHARATEKHGISACSPG